MQFNKLGPTYITPKNHFETEVRCPVKTPTLSAFSYRITRTQTHQTKTIMVNVKYSYIKM